MSAWRAGDPDYDPTTLHIPDAALKAMTKFNAQFWNIKRKARRAPTAPHHVDMPQPPARPCPVAFEPSLRRGRATGRARTHE